MQWERLAEDPVSEVRTERPRRAEVDVPPEERRELLPRLAELEEARSAVGLELDEDVDVAPGTEVVAENRPEERETPHPVATAEGRYCITRIP